MYQRVHRHKTDSANHLGRPELPAGLPRPVRAIPGPELAHLEIPARQIASMRLPDPLEGGSNPPANRGAS
jgi:hypothetical protein